MQIELDLPTPTAKKASAPLLKDIEHGKAFRFTGKSGNKSLHIRVKTVNYLNNSTLLADVFNRGDCVVCNLESGTVYICRGTDKIKRVEASIRVRK